MIPRFLDKSYATDSDLKQLYTDWSASYDAEVGENGYAAPKRAAEALAKVALDKSAPLMDIGCGTGLAGLAFRAAGFQTLDGMDVSQAMIDQASSRIDLYRKLTIADATTSLPFQPGDYSYVSAIGVFSPGHAQSSLIDSVLNALGSLGMFVFSINDYALADRSYEQRIAAWTDCGAARCIFREHGAHMPGHDLKSTIYVLQKA